MSDEIEGENEAASAEPRKAIPYERFAAVATERRAAVKEAEALRAKVTALEAEVGTHRTAAESAISERSALQDRYDLHRAGIDDDDGAEVARTLYQRIPAESRPKGGLAEWVAGLRAEPDKAPKPLTPYLTAAAPVATTAPRKPNENAAATGRAGEPINPDQITATQLAELRARYTREGRLADIKKDPIWIAYTTRRA